MTAPLDLTVYHACEAKFMAESAAGVGEDTVLAIIKADGTGCLLDGSAIEPIRRSWSQSCAADLMGTPENSAHPPC